MNLSEYQFNVIPGSDLSVVAGESKIIFFRGVELEKLEKSQLEIETNSDVEAVCRRTGIGDKRQCKNIVTNLITTDTQQDSVQQHIPNPC